MLYRYQQAVPTVDESAFIAPGAKIIGDVTIGKEASIWFNTVVRGDEAPIKIGARTNVQDNCTLHLYAQYPLILEEEVSCGHQAILHGCHVRRGALVGMGAVILDGAEIGEEAFIAANTLIPPGKKIPPRTMVMGSPGKVVRELTEKDLELLQMTVETYVRKSRIFKKQQKAGTD